MKRSFIIIISIFTLFTINYANKEDFGFKPLREKLRYKEEFLQLYNTWLYSDLDSISRNIYFLELATVLPFDHPIKALTPITNEIQYAHYTNLVMMHIYVLLTQEYINYGYLYVKEHLYFFNQEFKKEYLDGYEIAEFYCNGARKYWDKAIESGKAADNIKGCRTTLEYMEDEVARMKSGSLNYYKVIDNLLRRIHKNRDEIANNWGTNQ